MYHSMDATIGRDGHEFWLYGGTGNYQRINDITSPLMDNVLFGIKDEAYPYYRKVPWGRQTRQRLPQYRRPQQAHNRSYA